ncbi:MAG: hypothetical protein M1819_003680 [Sarea resinae]|nr:MAG: hypothetical protein M1819_003680 [Sarea resinae]
MSLSAHDPRSRGRSKSPGRERSRSRSRDTREPSPNIYAQQQQYQFEYANPNAQYANVSQAPADPYGSVPSPPGGFPHSAAVQYDMRKPSPVPGDHPSYGHPGRYEHSQVNARYADPDAYVQSSRPIQRAPSPAYGRPDDLRTVPPQERPQYADPGQYHYSQSKVPEQSYRPPPSPKLEHRRNASRGSSDDSYYDRPSPPRYDQQPHYAYAPEPQSRAETQYGRPVSPRPNSIQPNAEYAAPGQYQYAHPSQDIHYASKKPEPKMSYLQSPQAQIVQVKPGGASFQAPPSPGLRPQNTTSLQAPPSPGLRPQMHRLSVSGAGPSALTLTGQAPPGSPLLEAYRGTYQSISPMPSPMMLPSSLDDHDLDDLDSLNSLSDLDDEQDRRRPTRRRVIVYDPEIDALDIIKALKSREIDSAVLTTILPALSEAQMMQLRTEYKKHYKVPTGKGVNVAKHIKMKVPGAFGKACYATALGRWESEAYWANFWYQSNSSRRELLIESLMGRTNAEIHSIKDVFSDKRYGNDLTRCMKAELKADKFRAAILLALEAKRQEETVRITTDMIKRDTADLYRAISAKDGGESAMIQIVVTRSDALLREVIKAYDNTWHRNLARDIIKKSTNLVGELLAHILNGVINKPMRDALLLHHALTETTTKDRLELLISRLVRYHWDRRHMDAIRRDYQQRYGVSVEGDTARHLKGKGAFAEFCIALVRGGRH